jgi:hypothetical protein
MRKLLFVCLGSVLMLSCQDNESVKSEFTGNEATYALAPGSPYDIDGTVTFKEKVDGTTQISIVLQGTDGNIQHPVHLHLGKISEDDADIAALLSPVTGTTGKSETVLKQLADESTVSYSQLIAMDACVKVHLAAAGPDKDIILAGGNVGKAASDDVTGRLRGLGVCKSE